jgi:membrane protease YdiL (CAAX protease family)
MKKEKQTLTLYLIIVFVISIPIELLWIFYGEAGTGLAALLMLLPAVVAVILKLIFFRKEPLLGLGLGKKPAYYLFALVIPLVYIGLSYSLYWLFAPEAFAGTGIFIEIISAAFNVQNPNAAFILAAIAVSILVNTPVTFGEEAGWRGLMFPIMYKLWGRNKALITSGLIWAAWHLPVLVSGNYMPGANVLYKVPMFVITILACTVIVSWFRMKSGSVWPAVLWHSSHNFLDQQVFSPLTNSQNSAYFVGETGFITAGISVLFAVLILFFGKFDRCDTYPR